MLPRRPPHRVLAASIRTANMSGCAVLGGSGVSTMVRIHGHWLLWPVVIDFPCSRLSLSSSIVIPTFLKLSPTILMAGLRSITTRSRSRAPTRGEVTQPVRPNSKHKQVVSEDEEEDDEELLNLKSLSKQELLARLRQSQGPKGESSACTSM